VLTNLLAIALGFFAALFIVLLVAPAVARRVSDLTWRQAERVLPQSVEEIAAERDRLRGEFAVATRNIELKLENITARHNTDRVQLVLKEDRIAALDGEILGLKVELASRDAMIEAQRQAALAAEEAQLALRTELADVSVRLNSEQSASQALAAQKASVEAERDHAQADLQALTAKANRVAETNAALREKLESSDRQQRAIRADLRLAETQNRQFSRKLEALEQRLGKALADNADAEMRAQRTRKTVSKPPAAANQSKPEQVMASPLLPESPSDNRATQVRRQAKAFQAALPQVTQDAQAARRMAGPLMEIAAAAVRQAVQTAGPNSELAKMAASPALLDSALGRAIARRMGQSAPKD
jgi:chromosome segregation ATPase